MKLGVGAKKINRREKKVETTEEEIYYENLINTAPLNQFLDMLGKPEWVNVAKKLSYNKVLVLNLGFNGPSPKYDKEHWIYFPDKSLNFYRIGFYNNILGQRDLSVYAEIGFSKGVEKIDTKRELMLALSGMEKVGIINEGMGLVDKNVLLMDPAYVHIEEEEKNK